MKEEENSNWASESKKDPPALEEGRGNRGNRGNRDDNERGGRNNQEGGG